MNTKPFLLIKTGSSYGPAAEACGDFEGLFRQGLGLPEKGMEVFTPYQGDSIPKAEPYAGVLITGSHRMVTEQNEVTDALCQWLRAITEMDIPILGVCYGHQLLGKAFGGKVSPHPKGPEIGTVTIHLTTEAATDPLFNNTSSTFPAHTTHQQSVLALPKDTLVLASNRHDPHHAIRIGKQTWGVQFHPEFTASIMCDYITKQENLLIKNQQQPQQLKNYVEETPDSTQLLKRFAQYCRDL